MVSSDVGFLPIVFLSGRFPGRRRDGGRRRRRLWRRNQPSGMDGTSYRPEEAQTILKIPDLGTGERISVQRLRVQTETVGTGAKPQSNGEASEDLVSKSTDEEQEEQSAASGAAAEQQQQQ